MEFTVRGVTQTGFDALDFAVSDLQILTSGNSAAVFATSGANGGLASFTLNAGGVAAHADHAFFNPSWATGISGDLALTQDTNGNAQLVFGMTGATRLGAYYVDASGTIGASTHLNGLAAGYLRPEALAATGTGEILIAGIGEGFGCYSPGAAALSEDFSVTDNADSLVESVSAFAEVSVGGNAFIIAASDSENGVSAYQVTPGGPVLTDVNGPEQGLGIMTPTAMGSAQVDGYDYVVVASAQGQNGALSVLQIAPDGTLTATDHVLDTRDTRFGAVQDIEVIEIDGVTYVVAGGGDDGLSLFVLLPGGQLQFLDSIADTNAIGLTNVSAVAAAEVGGDLRIVAGSQSEGVLTDLHVDLGGFGAQLVAGSGGGDLNGTGQDDIIVGRAGNDRLYGGAGDDIIVDGGGVDRMWGNAGRDTFVLRDDGELDRIIDFDPALDRLDLSSWPMFYDPASLTIIPNGSGAEVLWRNERLILRSADGNPLTVAEVRNAVLQTINRPMDLSDIDFPDDRDHDITGTDGDDVLRAGDGNQTIAPGLGNDTIYAGGGSDTIVNGFGGDRIFLEGGNDTYRNPDTTPGAAGDHVDGGDGHDVIETGTGDDELVGGRGNDRLLAGLGDDVVDGGSGADTAYLGDGNDVYTDDIRFDGETENDEVHGGNGDDWVDAGGGNDTIFGEAGDDTLYGNRGNDLVDGGDGADRLYGGNGNDTLVGGDGRDVLFGDAGHDRAWGGEGNDTLVGGDGDDILIGGTGNDRLIGGQGHDTFVFGRNTGRDVIHDYATGADTIRLVGVRQSAVEKTEKNAGLLVDWGSGSVLLVGLDAGDFSISSIDFI